MSNSLETDHGKYTFLSNNSQKNNGSSALIIARHPGAANCLTPVGHFLYNKGYDLYFRTIDQGENIINAGFENRQEIKASNLPSGLNWTLISFDSPSDFEIETLKTARELGPQSKTCLMEDYPGNLDPLIQNLIGNDLTPSLILATTRNQADIYRKKYPLLERSTIVPIGQPSFDSLLAENTLSESRAARERLKIPEEMKLVTYIGLPAQDVPEDKVEFKPSPDFNSYILGKIAEAMINIATKYPQNQFKLINRPHPREADELWKHPELTKINNLPDNLVFISPSRTKWQQIGLTTRQVCTASDLVATVVSTVGQEAALSGARPNNKTKLGSLALHILPKDALDFYLPDGFALGETGATAYARVIDETQDEIEKCLFNEAYQRKIAEGQKHLLNDYRFKSGATSRVSLWMRAAKRYQ